MSELVANCPRCGANKITFDLPSAIQTRQCYGWQFWYEAFCICRQCRRSTIFVLSEHVDGDYEYVHNTGLVKINSAVNCYVTIEGTITLKDAATVEPPPHLPERIDAVFREGATATLEGLTVPEFVRTAIVAHCERSEKLHGRRTRAAKAAADMREGG